MRGDPRLRIAALSFLFAACAGHPDPDPGPDWSQCESAAADLPSLARVGELEGDYDLALHAHTGAKRGERTAGALTLIPADSAGTPFYGWTDIALAQVGAQEVGSASSTDLAAPGVLVLTVPDVDAPSEVASVTLRLGSEANQRGILRFDGAWTALYVRWIGDDGFGGEWSSGVTMPEATGSFCAVRPRAS